MVIFTLFFTLGVWLLQQQESLPEFVWAFPLALAPLTLIIPPRTRSLRSARNILIAVFACGCGFFHAAWQGEQRLAVTLADEWQGRDLRVIGVIAGLPHAGERGMRFAFDIEKTLTRDLSSTLPIVPEHIYLSTYFDRKKPLPEIHAGERWQFTVRLKQPHGSSNPHSFDFELWALENNIRALGYVVNLPKQQKDNNIRLDALADGLSYRIESWRESVRDKFDATLGNAPFKGVLSALAIGDQGSIPQAQWQIFTRTGINHLVSISGLHITMLAGIGFALIYRLWRLSTALTLRLPARKAAATAAVIVALGYALLSGYGVPAQRTVYMVGAVAIALWLNRNFSYSQILSIALLGVLFADPWAVLSPGFWLSFGAVALIMYVTAHRIDFPNKDTSGSRHSAHLIRVLREYTTIQWAMTIGLTPLLLGLFQQVSLVSPVANAFAIPLVSLIVVPLTLLGAILPTEIPLWLAHIVMDATMVPLEFLSTLPAAVWTQHAPPPWSIVIGMLGVLWILSPAGFPARWLGGLLMLPMFLNAPAPPADDTLRLIIFDVGQGLSVAAQTRHHALLYDTGPDFSGDADSGNRVIVPSLRGMGISQFDGLILSHDDIDHTGGTASVLQSIPIDWLSTSQAIKQLKTVEKTALPGAIHRCRDGASWNWDGVQFDILHPAAVDPSPHNDHPRRNKRKSHDNDMSCVLRISTGDKHILLTGDIEKRGERYLLEQHPEQLSTTLLVVPHHGSASSSDADFVAALLPDYAVFTSGYRNRFKHPREEILRRYADSGAVLLRSDVDGAILVEMTPQQLTIERYRISHRHYWMHISKTN